MKAIFPGPIVLAAALLAACNGSGPVADDAEQSGGLPAPATVNSSDPNGGPPPANAERGAAPAASGGTVPAIPAALQGRWGMVPADCTPGRADAKGLLEVGAAELRFYESRALPTGNARAADDSFSADFAFSGEGQRWSKFLTLRLEDNKLIRTESTPMASYTYARCS